MRKIFLMIAIIICNLTYAQTTHLGTETFSYNGNTVYHYGMGWYSDPDASAYGPMAYLSSYGGIKFFTTGSAKGVMDVWGRLGIGTTSPHSFVHVNTSSSQAYNSDFGALSITPTSDVNKSLSFGYDTSLGANGSGWIQSIKIGTAYTPLLLNPNNGDVAIGTTDSRGYKLAVNGAAIATSMKVKLQANWPDFVFLKDYKLPTLTEVKTYIDKNQHLPDMPSADEVHANGLDLGEMNRLLLKKVEELTLYLIEKDEQVKQLRKDINQLNQQQAINKQQEARTSALEALLLKLTATK